jgi:hypothetical protein
MNRPRLSLLFLILGCTTLALGIGLIVRAGGRGAPRTSEETAGSDSEALAQIAARLSAIERDGALRARPGVDPLPLREMVASAVAEELRNHAAANQPKLQEPPPATPQEAQRQTTASEAGRALLDRRLADRVWRADDARELRHLLVAMAPEDRDEVITTLTVAINKGLVRDEVDGPSF